MLHSAFSRLGGLLTGLPSLVLAVGSAIPGRDSKFYVGPYFILGQVSFETLKVHVTVGDKKFMELPEGWEVVVPSGVVNPVSH